MSVCAWRRDPETGKKFFLPGCMGGAAGGPDHCTCYRITTVRKAKVEKLLDEMEELAVESRNYRLVTLARDIRHEVVRMMQNIGT